MVRKTNKKGRMPVNRIHRGWIRSTGQSIFTESRILLLFWVNSAIFNAARPSRNGQPASFIVEKLKEKSRKSPPEPKSEARLIFLLKASKTPSSSPLCTTSKVGRGAASSSLLLFTLPWAPRKGRRRRRRRQMGSPFSDPRGKEEEEKEEEVVDGDFDN